MNSDVFAQWFREQGHRVVRTPSSYWAQLGPRVLQAIPFHLVITPAPGEVRDLLRREQAIAARYSTPLSAAEGMVSYHVVYAGKDYGLDKLPKKARYDVRKGLEKFAVEPIPFAGLAAEGWELRHQTLIRQGRTGAETPEWWQRLCNTADGRPGFESWGARNKETGLLSSALLTFRCDNCVLILYQQSRTDDLPLGVNNVLSFAATSEFLSRDGVDSVFYGLHSLDAPESVDAYKWRMRFSPMPVRQCVVFHPWVAPLANDATHAMLKAVLKRRPSSATLAKAEGMVRFYREGLRPLQQQNWPEALADVRKSLDDAPED